MLFAQDTVSASLTNDVHADPPRDMFHRGLASSAEDIMLSDVDAFVEWLGIHTHGSPRISLGAVWLCPADLAVRVETMSIPELVALSLYPADRARSAAMRELSSRFLAAHPGHLADIEAELMAGV
jgi:hypothetical protein